MKLSERLSQFHESGDFGQALLGIPEAAKALEEELAKLNSSDCILVLKRKILEFSNQNEIARLTNELKKSNEQSERFEREWYLRGDALERAENVARNACEGWNDALMHEGAGIAADAIKKLLVANE